MNAARTTPHKSKCAVPLYTHGPVPKAVVLLRFSAALLLRLPATSLLVLDTLKAALHRMLQTVNPLSLSKRWKQRRDRIVTENYPTALGIETQKPRAPLPRLRRKLKILSVRGASTAQGPLPYSSNEQVNSILLNWLSFDIREQIYRLVLGEQCFHIIKKGNCLAFLLCQAQEPRSHFHDACWGCASDNGTFVVRQNLRYIRPEAALPWDDSDCNAQYNADGGLLPLLLSCRRV